MAAGRAGLADADPWHGFVSFAEVFVRLGSLSCGVKDAVRGQGVLDLQSAVESIGEQVKGLVARAQESGAMSRDVNSHDVACVLVSAFRPPRWGFIMGPISGGAAWLLSSPG
jgi:hypothetical protein